MNTNAKEMLGKVPEVTLLFWIIKIAATTLGETAGDMVTMSMNLGYLAATGLPLMLSSQRTVALLGTIVLIGSAIAFVAYWEAFVSVWCFFAAAASVVVLGHFEWARQRRLGAKPV